MTEWHLGIANNFASGEMIRVGERAGALGFSALWMADIRLWRDCYTALGAVAATTNDVRLGSSVSDAYSRHPATLAAIAATLDELAPGRVMLGVGAGGSGMATIGAERDHPLGTVEALVRGLRCMLSGEVADATAPAFALAGAQLHFVPANRIPIAMAASGPLMYRLAGRVADIVFLGRYLELSGISHVRERVAEGLAQRDSSLGPIEEILRVDVSISERDPAAAADVMRARVDGLMRAGYRTDAFLGPIGLGELATTDRALSADEIDRIAGRVSLAGRPAEVAERIAGVIAAADLSKVSLSPHVVPGQSLEDAVQLTADAIAQVGSPT